MRPLHFCLLLFDLPLSSSMPSRPRKDNSSAVISPSSVAWSYPRRCKAPCRISQRISVQVECPAAAAFRRAVSAEITISPRKPANSPFQPPSWSFLGDSAPNRYDPRSCQGNESTSVGLGLPRNPSFNRRMLASSTKQTLNHCALSPSAALSPRTKARARAFWTVTLVCRFAIIHNSELMTWNSRSPEAGPAALLPRPWRSRAPRTPE